MIRPDAADMLSRWREAAIGAVALVLGGWLWSVAYGVPALLGGVAAAVGAVLLISGIRRALFRSDAEAPGLVEVDEGRITYLGPVMGGSVEIDDLNEIAFRRTATGEAFWRLSQAEGRPLAIPEGAAGAERLLDALVSLPRLDTGAMVRAIRAPAPATIVVWRRPGTRAPHPALTGP